MGNRAKADLSYGVILDSHENYSWENDNFKEWYMFEIQGYERPFEMFDEKGEWLREFSDSEKSLYYAHKHEFSKKHPCPFELVRHGSCVGESENILAVITIGTDWDEPYKVNFPTLDETSTSRDLLITFCKQQNIPYESIGWYISAYWG